MTIDPVTSNIDQILTEFNNSSFDQKYSLKYCLIIFKFIIKIIIGKEIKV